MNLANPTLVDPRHYPAYNAQNQIIFFANSVLQAKTVEETEEQKRHLTALLTQALKQDEMLKISVAIAMAPSAAIYQLIWQTIRNIIEIPQQNKAIIFCLPLILVLGAKQQSQLPASIANVDGLNQFFKDQQIFSPECDVYLSGQLISPNQMTDILPTQLLRFSEQLVDVAKGLPLELKGQAIHIENEGVFSRYLVGIGINRHNNEAPVKLSNSIGRWGQALAKWIGNELKTTGVTLFPIPRAPQAFMKALEDGEFIRKDVALQVFSSTQIRHIRDTGDSVVAFMDAVEPNELHFTIQAENNTQLSATYVWQLAPSDVVPEIETAFRSLMIECKVDQVYPEAL